MSNVEDFFGGLSRRTLKKNYIINGNFDIWQRGTSQTAVGYGSDDRWQNDNVGTTKVHSRQTFTLGQTDVPGNPKYFSRTVVTSVAGTNNYYQKLQRVEGVASLSGKTATLSFWAKADAAKNIAIEFYQYFGTGGSPSTAVYGICPQLVALTTSWKKYTVTANIPSISGKTLGTDGNDSLIPIFWFDAGSNHNIRTANLGQQSGTFDIAQVQLEEGSVATEFECRTYADELTLCQRYFQKSGILYGYAASSAHISVCYSAIQEFRTIPIVVLPTTSLAAESPPWVTSVNSTASVISSGHIAYSIAKFDILISGFTGLIARYPASLRTPIWFDAEL